MFPKYSFNVGQKDSILRIILATCILLYGMYSGYLSLLLLSAFLYFTAFQKFCIVYYLFRINESLSKKHYYLSFLPQHNPSAVFIFDLAGKLVFKNNAAIKLLPDVTSPESINIQEFKKNN